MQCLCHLTQAQLEVRRCPKRIKRPLNCFMVYCKHELEKVKTIHPDKKQPEIRTILGKQWKALSPNEQKIYRNKAKALNELHSAQYHDYKFKPGKKGQKCLTKQANKSTATVREFPYQNQLTWDSSHVPESTAIGNLYDVTGVQVKPRFIQVLQRLPLQKEKVQQDIVQQALTETGIVFPYDSY